MAWTLLKKVPKGGKKDLIQLDKPRIDVFFKTCGHTLSFFYFVQTLVYTGEKLTNTSECIISNLLLFHCSAHSIMNCSDAYDCEQSIRNHCSLFCVLRWPCPARDARLEHYLDTKCGAHWNGMCCIPDLPNLIAHRPVSAAFKEIDYFIYTLLLYEPSRW